MPLGKRFVKNS